MDDTNNMRNKCRGNSKAPRRAQLLYYRSDKIMEPNSKAFKTHKRVQHRLYGTAIQDSMYEVHIPNRILIAWKLSRWNTRM